MRSDRLVNLRAVTGWGTSMTALNAQIRMDFEAASIGSSVVTFVRKFPRFSHIPLVALVFALGACSGNGYEPSSSEFENQKISQTVNNSKLTPKDYSKLESKTAVANEVSEIVSPNVIFENFSEAQLAYLSEINIPAEVSKMSQERYQSIELNTGNRLFIAAGESVKNLCKSFYGSYDSPRSDCPSSYKMAQVSARAKRDFSLINVG